MEVSCFTLYTIIGPTMDESNRANHILGIGFLGACWVLGGGLRATCWVLASWVIAVCLLGACWLGACLLGS